MSKEFSDPQDELAAARFTVVARGSAGVIFRSVGAEAFCFVPKVCLRRSGTSQVEVDEVAYLASGWGLRNMRLAGTDLPGRFIFPDAAAPVNDLDEPEVRSFVQRLG